MPESLPRMVRRASEVRAIRHQLQREFYTRWEESKHPRDEDGQFSEKEGGKRSRKAPRKTPKHFPALSMRLDDYIEKNHPNAISLALYKEGGSEWFQEHYPDVDLLEDIFRPEREIKEEWQFQARAAFSVGAITGSDLNTLVETYPGEKGVAWKWSGVGRAQPDGPDSNVGDLPGTLYHATTAATPVEDMGLKSREELNQSFGAGLGGGDDDTISFTTDRELAETIASTIKLGRRVARGEVTVDDLMRDAREGVGTNGKPYDSDQLKKQVEDIHRPQNKFGWKPTVATDSDGNPTSYESSFGPWEPDPKHEPNEKGNHVHWVRHPNEEQVLDRTMSAFKYWLAYREAAGGPPDPLFFLSDAAGLANLDEDEIKVVEAKPVDGAKGYQVSAMSEWRTWSGDSVDIVDIYRRQLQSATNRGDLDREFYRRGFYNKQFDESKIKRDEGGKFSEKEGGKTFSPKTAGASVEQPSGRYSFTISAPDGSKVQGYETLGEMIYDDKPDEVRSNWGTISYIVSKTQRQGMGTSLAKDAIRLMSDAGSDHVVMRYPTEAGKALNARLVRDGVIGEAVATGPAGFALYPIIETRDARRLQSASYARRLDREFSDRGFYANAKFDESKVKRDADGKFATKSGSGKTDGEVYTDYLLGQSDYDEVRERAWEKHQEQLREVKEQMAAEAKAKADAKKAKADAKKKFWSVKRDSTPTVNAVRNLEKTKQLLMDDLIDIVNKELDKKGQIRGIRIGGSEIKMVDERKSQLNRILWGTHAGHDSLMDRIPELSNEARVYAKLAVQARLADRMMPLARKLYAPNERGAAYFGSEKALGKHVENKVRDWVDQWAMTSGKGTESIALQLSALAEFDLGTDERFEEQDAPKQGEEYDWDESRERSQHASGWDDAEFRKNLTMYTTVMRRFAEKTRLGMNNTTAVISRLAENLMDTIAADTIAERDFRVPTSRQEFDEAIDFLSEVRQQIEDSSTDPLFWHSASSTRQIDLLGSEIDNSKIPGHTPKGVDHLESSRFKHYAHAMFTVFGRQITTLMDLKDVGNRPPKTEMDKETLDDPDRMPTDEEAWSISMDRIWARSVYDGFDHSDIWSGVGHLKKEYTSTLKLLAQVPKPLPGSSEEAVWIKAKREAEKGLADLADIEVSGSETATSNYPAAADKVFNSIAWAAQDRETLDAQRLAERKWNGVRSRNREIRGAHETLEDNIHPTGEMMRSFVRAQYDETQEKLAEAGYKPDDTIALYRGMNFTDEQLPEALKGGSPEFTESDTVQSAMSSYSMNFSEAATFATNGDNNSAMTAAHVPVGSILSLPTTGVGCLTEGEVVVLRNDGKKYMSVYGKSNASRAVDRHDMQNQYLKHLRENWQGPTGQRLDNGHGHDLVPTGLGEDTPAWYSRIR